MIDELAFGYSQWFLKILNRWNLSDPDFTSNIQQNALQPKFADAWKKNCNGRLQILALKKRGRNCQEMLRTHVWALTKLPIFVR